MPLLADRSRLPQLTGLRGLAAVIVFISHAAIVGLLPDPFGHGFGQVGVMVFFVLSGFLMTHLYIGRTPNRSAVGAYARARVGRVMPLYLAIVGMSVLISNFLFTQFRYNLPLNDPAQILRAIFFIEAPWELWTIPVEVQFYAVFIVAWLLYRRLGIWSLVVIGAAISVPAVLYFVFLGAKPSILPTYGFAFVVGGLIAELRPRLRFFRGLMANVAGPIFFVLIFVNTPQIREHFGLGMSRDSGYVATWLDPLTWFIVMGLFVSCLSDSAPLRFLDSKPFGFLGDISYGFYLMHYPLLEIAIRLYGTNAVSLLVAAASSIALAWLSWRFFERPALRRIRNARKRTIA